MIRTQIYLPEEMHQFAKTYSRNNKTTLSAMLREAFEEKFMKQGQSANNSHQWLTDSIGMLRSCGEEIDHNEIYDAPLPWEK